MGTGWMGTGWMALMLSNVFDYLICFYSQLFMVSIKLFREGQRTARFQYEYVCIMVNNRPQPEYVSTDCRTIKEFTNFFYVEYERKVPRFTNPLTRSRRRRKPPYPRPHTRGEAGLSDMR